MVGEQSSEPPAAKTDSQHHSRAPPPLRVILPQPLNTIYPVPEDSEHDNLEVQDDGVPSPTAQQVRKLDTQLTSAPAPIPIPSNRGTKRRSPIQVVLQPKKSRPSPSLP
ncbi:hypothetical protein HRI_001494700 [Hibiscus trionum]|uniref:Uncharacterized protein n=1 Tax=Hibiscus trionum TaxID=183268 RepID=A0A9W7HIL4_HIBTR|nr:hypothetical protein HRI_001494700 [Hibiscus trionum]